MAVNNEPNPYAPPDTSAPVTRLDEATASHKLTDDDIKDLRVGTRLANERMARIEPYLWPAMALLFASYQFWMCWTVSRNSGVSFAELVFHDGSGFPAPAYDGAFVRMFDRFVTGFFFVVVAGFLLFLARSSRKRQLQNHRFHMTMLDAGLVPHAPGSTDTQAGG